MAGVPLHREWNIQGVDLLADEAECAAAVNDRRATRMLVELTNVFCFLFSVGSRSGGLQTFTGMAR